MPDFVTLDFETTGLTPTTNRVIEIGMVRTSQTGQVVAEFSSLVNPQRDVGRTDIHGITAGMLDAAPSFADISGHVAEILDGAVLVAHNAKFDSRFLAAEFNREGRQFDQFDPLCTLELMYQGYPRGPRKLVECCRFLGIAIRDAHCALDDAQMASDLLHHLLTRVRPAVMPQTVRVSSSPDGRRDPLPREQVRNPRDQEASYLAALMGSLPDEGPHGVTSAVSAAQYLNLLDRVLEDRKIDADEAEELVAIAGELGLSADRVGGLNAAYMASLCSIAASDGEVTESERTDLATVARLLLVDEWEPLLNVGDTVTRAAPSQHLSPGLTVCFTGEMTVSRSEIEARSTVAGLVIKSAVSRKLDVLVVADSDSGSTKAKKARELDVRIVHEQVFLRMLEEVGA